jgi:hypothetical protein
MDQAKKQLLSVFTSQVQNASENIDFMSGKSIFIY